MIRITPQKAAAWMPSFTVQRVYLLELLNPDFEHLYHSQPGRGLSNRSSKPQDWQNCSLMSKHCSNSITYKTTFSNLNPLLHNNRSQ